MFNELPVSLRHISNRWAVRMIVRSWLGIAVAIGVATALPNPIVWLICAVFVGVMQDHLAVLSHHALHKNLLTPPRLNDVVASWVLLAPLGVPLTPMRMNHMRHHNEFRQPEDYEYAIYDLEGTGRATPGRLVAWLVGSFLGVGLLSGLGRVILGVRHSIARATGAKTPFKEWLIVVVTQLLLFLALWVLTGRFWAWGVLWLAPAATMLVGLSATRAMLEHADLRDDPPRLFTFPAPAFERFLLAPFHFNYHAEHHRFAAVPACLLKALHAHLDSSGQLGETRVCPSYSFRFRELLREVRASRREFARRRSIPTR